MQVNLSAGHAARAAERSAQNAEVLSAKQAERTGKDEAANKRRVAETQESQRNDARANDEAAAATRRAEIAATSKAEAEHRAAAKTIGRHIDTTA